MNFMHPNKLDTIIGAFDKALRVVADSSVPLRQSPAAGVVEASLHPDERRHSAGLMRVNHVGEVCAQALYDAQSRFARSDVVRKQFLDAGLEEADHLAWTSERLRELGAHPSLLNVIWYAGAYGLGALAARIGDMQSLGFVVETERQVEMHLASHLDKLPVQDRKSRAILKQMQQEEIAHAASAQSMGAAPLPVWAKRGMKLFGKIMTSTAYYI